MSQVRNSPSLVLGYAALHEARIRHGLKLVATIAADAKRYPAVPGPTSTWCRSPTLETDARQRQRARRLMPGRQWGGVGQAGACSGRAARGAHGGLDPEARQASAGVASSVPG
jgi:hypothetical protein